MTGSRPRARAIGIFGGTFDPIHFGHLRTAFEVLQKLALDELRFVPGGDPPHRAPPRVDAVLRLELVRAAVAGQPRFVVDDREVRRAGPSFSVLTLGELRAEFPASPLFLIVGMDAFAGLPTWHRWRELCGLAHIVVAPRPGWTAPAEGPLGELLATHGAAGADELRATTHGRVFIQPVTQLEISSSELRAVLAAGGDPRYLVPDAVREVILRTGCYSESRPTR